MRRQFEFEAEPFELYSEFDNAEEPLIDNFAGTRQGEVSRKNPDYIRWVQDSLNRLMNLRLPVTGIIDAATHSAIRSFQEREKLPSNGIIGADTEWTLMAARSGASNWNNQEFEFTAQESQPGLTQPIPKTIWLPKTDLDAPYSGGDFNFLYKGGANEALITFNTHLSFREKYPEAEKRKFINNLRFAVGVWDSAAEVQIKDINGNYNKKIKFRFKLNLVRDPKNSNKKTDIHPKESRSTWFIGKNREIVMRDLNVFIDSSRNVLVHEFGHVWGLEDEYDTSWIEKKFSPGHVGTDSPLIKDKKAIMNEGYAKATGEFRGRYFRHFAKTILNAFRGLKNYVIPIKRNGKVVSRVVQGRIALLKKDIAGSPPYAKDVLPFNPRFTFIHVKL